MSLYNPVYLHAVGVYAVYLKNKAVAYIKGIKHRRARKVGLKAAAQRWGSQQAVMDALAQARANAETAEERQLIKAQQFMFLYGSGMWPMMAKDLERDLRVPKDVTYKGRRKADPALDGETTGGTTTGRSRWGESPIEGNFAELERRAVAERMAGAKPPSASWESHFPGLSPEIEEQVQRHLMQDLQRKLKHRRNMSIGKQRRAFEQRDAELARIKGLCANRCTVDELPLTARRELVDTPDGIRSLPVQPTPQARRDYGVKSNPEDWEIVYVQNPSIEGQRRQGLWKYVAYAKTGERLTCMTQDTAKANQWLKELREFKRTAVNSEYQINAFM